MVQTKIWNLKCNKRLCTGVVRKIKDEYLYDSKGKFLLNRENPEKSELLKGKKIMAIENTPKTTYSSLSFMKNLLIPQIFRLDKVTDSLLKPDFQQTMLDKWETTYHYDFVMEKQIGNDEFDIYTQMDGKQ